eukprot:325894-Prorocentrum_minimum.AAC.3
MRGDVHAQLDSWSCLRDDILVSKDVSALKKVEAALKQLKSEVRSLCCVVANRVLAKCSCGARVRVRACSLVSSRPIRDLMAALTVMLNRNRDGPLKLKRATCVHMGVIFDYTSTVHAPVDWCAHAHAFDFEVDVESDTTRLQRQRHELIKPTRRLFLPDKWSAIRLAKPQDFYKTVAASDLGMLVSVFDGSTPYNLGRTMTAKRGLSAWAPMDACYFVYKTKEQASTWVGEEPGFKLGALIR